jgi:LuxR family maltose regulon positive regulatory protein
VETFATPGVPLATKLYPPRSRAGAVRRGRLFDLLRAGLEVPLTLVTAPAGWGKSMLVADWIEHDRVPAGWVSLDRGDSDPMMFWRYVLLAARSVTDGASSGGAGTPGAASAAPDGRAVLAEAASAALRRLGAAGVQIERDVLPPFLNVLVQTPTPLVLVLDDFHLVSGSRVHTTLVEVLERCPPTLHLVLISRTEPRLALSRLRLAGRLVEARARDLAFTADEAALFFTGQVAVPLTAGDVGRLVDRTEGWVAGLQLAALRLRERDDPTGFIDRFTGADRHVVDYLSEEVLASLPADRLDFLLKTSVLDRISAPLARAVTGRPEAGALLEQVARADLFLIPLDDEHRWFRYHHLFGDLLRHELTRTDPDAVHELHARAADWFAAAHDYPDAIAHAHAAGDPDGAGRFVAAGWRAELNAGRWERVHTWLSALPADQVAADPALSVARAWAGLDSGRLDEVAAALGAARAHGTADAHLKVLHALYAFKMGDLERAWTWLAEARVDGRDAFVSTVHSLVGGVVMLWSGRLLDADRLLVQATHRAADDGNGLAHLYAVGARALVALGLANHREAWELTAQAEHEVVATMSEEHFVAMLPALARARLELSAAPDHRPDQRPDAVGGDGFGADGHSGLGQARSAVSLARRGAGRVELAAALLTAGAARAQHAPADPVAREESQGWVFEARALLDASRDPGPVVTSWLVAQRRQAGADTAGADGQEALTERELDILRLLPGASSQRQLAGLLFVTPNTLKTHLRAIYRKLGVQSRSEAVLSARRQGLI